MEAFVALLENAVGSSPFASEPTPFPQPPTSILPMGVHSLPALISRYPLPPRAEMFDSQVRNSLASLSAGSIVVLVDLRPDSRPMRSLLLAVILELVKRDNLFNSDLSLLWSRLRWHFADDPMTDSNFADLQLINSYLLDYVAADQSCLDALFQMIGVWVQSKPPAIYNFFPFLVNLLVNSKKLRLYQRLSHSGLLLGILRSGQDLPVFDFLRHLVSSYTEVFEAEFQFPVRLLNGFRVWFADPIRRASVVRCINDTILSDAVQSSGKFVKIVQLVCLILRDCVDRHDAGGFDLYAAIMAGFTRCSQDELPGGFLHSISELTTQFPERFYATIDMLSAICEGSAVLAEIVSAEDALFEALNCHTSNSPPTASELQRLMRFLLGSCNLEPRLIANPRALSVLLGQVRGHGDVELQVANSLLALANSSANFYAMHSGGILTFVLDALPSLDSTLRARFLQLFEAVAASMCTPRILWHSVKVLNTIDAPHQLLEVMLRLLTHPCGERIGFFRIGRGYGRGIRTPRFAVPRHFSMCFRIRVLACDQRNLMPFLVLRLLDMKSSYSFGVQQRRLVVNGTPLFEVVADRWHSIRITFCKNNVLHPRFMTVQRDEGPIGKIPISGPLDVLKLGSVAGQRHIEVDFGCASGQSQTDCLPCDISTVSFSGDNDEISVSFNPLNVIHNELYGVPGSPIRLDARVIPFMQSFRDVFMSPITISNFLPLFKRLFNEGFEEGQQFFGLLIQLFEAVITAKPELIDPTIFFPVFGSFLTDVQSCYIDADRLFAALLAIFRAVPDKTDMINWFWLNFDMLQKWDDRLRKRFFGQGLKSVFESRFHDVPVQSLLYATWQYFPEATSCVKEVDEFWTSMIGLYSHSSKLTDSIVRLAVASVTEFQRQRWMNWLYQLMTLSLKDFENTTRGCPTSDVAQRAMRETAPHARGVSKAK
jgi:hypothetical protein